MCILKSNTNITVKINAKKYNIGTIYKQIIEAYFFNKINIYIICYINTFLFIYFMFKILLLMLIPLINKLHYFNTKKMLDINLIQNVQMT